MLAWVRWEVLWEACRWEEEEVEGPRLLVERETSSKRTTRLVCLAVSVKTLASTEELHLEETSGGRTNRQPGQGGKERLGGMSVLLTAAVGVEWQHWPRHCRPDSRPPLTIRPWTRGGRGA